MGTEIHELSDESLIVLVAQGDALAFEEIDRRWRKLLVGFIAMRVGNVADADDLAQSVLVKAWERAATYKESSGAFKSWIKRMAANAIVDQLRHRRRQKRGGSLNHTEIVEEIQQVKLQDDEPEVDFGQLEELVQLLPFNERRAVMAMLREESAAELSDKTELSRSKIARLRAAALERMRECVCEREGGEITIRHPDVCQRLVQQTLF